METSLILKRCAAILTAALLIACTPSEESEAPLILTEDPQVNAEAQATLDAQATHSANVDATVAAQMGTLSVVSADRSSTQVAATEQVIGTATAGYTNLMVNFTALLTEPTQGETDALLSALSQTPPTYTFDDGKLFYTTRPALDARDASIFLTNYAIRAEFLTPYAAQDAVWTVGIVFRDDPAVGQFRLVIDSRGTWSLQLWSQSRAYPLTLQSGWITVPQEANQPIRMVVVAAGLRGLLIVDGVFVSTLALTHRQGEGSVLLATDFHNNRAEVGEVTEYRDWAIWTLPEE